jgi:hypothetical protein
MKSTDEEYPHQNLSLKSTDEEYPHHPRRDRLRGDCRGV